MGTEKGDSAGTDEDFHDAKKLPAGDHVAMLGQKVEEAFKGIASTFSLEHAQPGPGSDGRGGHGHSVVFEEFGLRYIGPIDGHDLKAMEEALQLAKSYGAPVIVHAITQKGRGYNPALEDKADQFHAVGQINPESGMPLKVSGSTSWTGVFADQMVQIGQQNENVVAITGAMLIPVGLDKFASRFPDRTFDVGIAEQHAVASAAGMAFGGLHPVVAIYSTFLNRAFDQLLMDVALHKAGVTFVLDRAGITGPDGASHHGVWDLSILQVVPGIRLAAHAMKPLCAKSCRRQLTSTMPLP